MLPRAPGHAKKQDAEAAVSAFNRMTTSCDAGHILLRKGIE
jgi:hypothetical protein